MKPKAEFFFDAITLLREDIVEEAQDYRFRKKWTVWKKFGALAACLVLIASVSLMFLPMRGCGGSAPDMNGSGSSMQDVDGCAPADAPAAGEPAPEPAEDPDSPEGGYGQLGQGRFTAAVIEVRAGSIIVETEGPENDAGPAGRFAVPTGGLELPELREGDRVWITLSGDWTVSADDPPEIGGVSSIEKIEG